MRPLKARPDLSPPKTLTHHYAAQTHRASPLLLLSILYSLIIMEMEMLTPVDCDLTDDYYLVIIPNMKMTPKLKFRYEARSNVLKALAHPTRLFIVEELAKKPRCVYELTEMVGADISTVSKHLSILKSAGLLHDEKLGKKVYYGLRMRCALNFFDCIEAVLKEQAKDRIAVTK